MINLSIDAHVLFHDSPQTVLQMDAPGCLLGRDVTTLSMEKKTKLKATPLREQNLSAKASVHVTFITYFVIPKKKKRLTSLYFQCL